MGKSVVLLFFGCPYCDSQHISSARNYVFTIKSLLAHIENHRFG